MSDDLDIGFAIGMVLGMIFLFIFFGKIYPAVEAYNFEQAEIKKCERLLGDEG